MQEDEVRRIIEQQVPVESGLSQQSIEDLVAALTVPERKFDEEKNDTPDRIDELKIALEREEDWRKKASLAAQIISVNLE